MALTKQERQSHLALDEACICRGADSIQCRGLLAHHLDTTVPKSYLIVLAHACHNPDCNNPKHLYWATRSENEEDKFASPDGERLRENRRTQMTGSGNPNYGKKPWMMRKAHVASWKQAGHIYEKYYSQGWDFSKYGQGLTYFINKYGIVAGSGKTMIKMFREGWIPSLDVDWLAKFQ